LNLNKNSPNPRAQIIPAKKPIPVNSIAEKFSANATNINAIPRNFSLDNFMSLLVKKSESFFDEKLAWLHN
tara:strand:+ start:290 stop:502 length:213 start_codon:yes stop_codon:yes gene_type:complete